MAPFLHFADGRNIYPSVPTLERIAAIKVAITLWSRNDIKALIREQLAVVESSEFLSSQWKKIEEKVRSYAEQLSLPQLPKKEVSIFVNPIGLEILEWKEFQKRTFGETVDYNLIMPNQLCWTAYGSIDVKKTLETLVKDEDLSVDLRYKVACTYCLEIRSELKDRVSGEIKDPSVEADEYWNQMHMWLYIMEQINTLECKAQMRDDCSDHTKMRIGALKQKLRGKYHHLLNESVGISNKLAVEYFMTKLPFEQERDFLEFALDVQHGRISVNSHFKFESELFFFLYSQIREEQQAEMFEAFGHGLLKCCLNWPWQDLFLPVAGYLQTFIQEGWYEDALTFLVQKSSDGFKDYDYSQLFTDVWKQSLVKHKISAIQSCAEENVNLFRCLFEIGDKENIKLMWEDASPKLQKKIIAFCKEQIATVPNNPDTLDDQLYGKKSMWENLLLFLNGLCCEGGTKRKMDQTNCNPCKKTHAMVP